MSKILKLTDRVPVKIDDITVKISPLSYLQKLEIQDHMIAAASGDMKSAMLGAAKAIKYSVKDIEGVQDYHGNKFELSFDEQGYLQEECVDNLLNLSQNNKLITVCAAFINGLPEGDLVNPQTGEALEGISFGEVQGK